LAQRIVRQTRETQILEIHDQLTQDLSIWELLTVYKPDLFCGLFMRSSNDGPPLSAKALHSLGQRGIELGLCIDNVADKRANVVQGAAQSDT
jgi:hypothetical protein